MTAAADEPLGAARPRCPRDAFTLDFERAGRPMQRHPAAGAPLAVAAPARAAGAAHRGGGGPPGRVRAGVAPARPRHGLGVPAVREPPGGLGRARDLPQPRDRAGRPVQAVPHLLRLAGVLDARHLHALHGGVPARPLARRARCGAARGRGWWRRATSCRFYFVWQRITAGAARRVSSSARSRPWRWRSA